MVLGKVNQIPFIFVSSVVAWRTRFIVEVIGTDGYVIVNGRGRSDGPQTLTIGRRWGWQNASSQVESELSSVVMIKDSSISKETIAWLSESDQVCSGAQAFESMKFYQKILSKEEPDGL